MTVPVDADKLPDSEVAAQLQAAVENVLARGSGRNWLAVSGGLDSMVLLRVASSLRDRHAFTVLHVDHGVHAHSAQWAVHVRRAAESYNLGFRQTQLQLADGAGMEARARAARYAWFAELLLADDHLLTAHHQSDQAETALLRMLQGRGGYGMPEQRPLGLGRLYRPFLHMPHDRLLQYASCENLRWVEDDSNADARYTRNFVRQELLPLARRTFANTEKRLASAAVVHAAQDAAGRMLVAACSVLPLARLRGLPPAAAIEVLRWWLLGRGLALARDAIRELLVWLDGGSGQRRRFDTHSVWVQADAVHIVRHAPQQPVLLSSRGLLQLPHGRLEVARPAGVTVRFRRGGERLLVSDSQSGRGVKLSEIFRTSGVHPARRDGYPLLYIGERLVAVPNLRDPMALGAVWRENYGASVEVEEAIC